MFVVIVLSVLAGILLTFLLQWLFIKKWFWSLPVLSPPWKDQYDKFYLPMEIREALRDPELKKKKETCLCLNLLFQFLFQELRDTRRVRRWVMRRMNMEFTEMLQTTTGKLLDQITVRDFNLGGTFPIIKNICVQNTVVKDESLMEELSLLMDLSYRGGFQLAVDVDMVFGKSAYLSVKVTKLIGRARLQLTRIPFTHWSFSFIEDPVMEFEVESHFEGRPVPQVTSLIVNQIRRSVRKKHTLPNYKIRYKPFFIKPEAPPPPQDIYYRGNKLSMGHLQVTVLGCNRLVKVVGGAYMYCTLALDTVPWLELMSSRRKLWVAHDIEILKTMGQNIGLAFRDDYILDRYEDMVIVDVVTPYSPAALANIKKNDVVVAVGGVKVTNTKQAAKLMKQATDKLIIRVERASPLKGLRESYSTPDFKFEEDTLSYKDPDLVDDPEPNKDEADDYINITIPSVSSSQSLSNNLDSKSVSKETASSEGVQEEESLPGYTNSSPSKKAFSILSSSAGLFHRKRGKVDRERDNKSPGKSGSPEPSKTKVDSQSQKVVEEDSDQKTKVPGAKIPSPEPVRKRVHRDSGGSLPGSKDRNSSSNPKLDALGSMESLDPMYTMSAEELAEQDSIDLKKTDFLPAAEDLVFHEKFEFDIEEPHNFLNVCVWCKIPEKLDKQNRVVKPEKDILIGHVSIPLMDITLECLATLQGDFRMTYKLKPAEMKAGASRTKLNLSAHPGFDEKLCYGDITMDFSHHHSSGPFSRLDRDNINKMKQDAESEPSVPVTKFDRNSKVQQTIKRVPPEEGKHDFIGTHFQSATYCNFCHKKIWLKTAFQCQVCGMVCHKKCTERCQAQTICTKKGFQIKEPPSTVFRKSVKEQNKEKEEPKEVSAKETSGGHRASFLSKFRREGRASDQGSKELTVEAAKSIRRPSTPEVTVDVDPSLAGAERKRHNSAPDEEHLLAGSTSDQEGQKLDDNLLSAAIRPRTRSSTSISDLIKTKISPRLSRKKVIDSSGDISDSDEDDMNLIRFHEQQKKANNADELVVTAAKEMGKELYAHLDFEQRKEKLDSMICKLQEEINEETANRSELCRLERTMQEPVRKAAVKAKVEKSDEKVQSLALLMLHYCAGLQHCMEEQEIDRQRQQIRGFAGADPVCVDTEEPDVEGAKSHEDTNEQAQDMYVETQLSKESTNEGCQVGEVGLICENLLLAQGLVDVSTLADVSAAQFGNVDRLNSLGSNDGVTLIDRSSSDKETTEPIHSIIKTVKSQDSVETDSVVLSFQALLSKQDSDSDFGDVHNDSDKDMVSDLSDHQENEEAKETDDRESEEQVMQIQNRSLNLEADQTGSSNDGDVDSSGSASEGSCAKAEEEARTTLNIGKSSEAEYNEDASRQISS